jgi:hypothetical protein
MTFVGFIGILFSLAAFAWFAPRKDNIRLALFLIIVILHVISAYVYYIFVQNNDADTKLYYYDVYDFFPNGFGLSTMFVIWVTQSLKIAIGGTYLDYFMLYQMLGVWGLALVMRTMEEAATALDTQLQPAMLALMFVPGMYFWTSAIGKDAPLFLACALAVWSSFRISSRWLWFALAVGIMVLIRAHIGLLTVASLALALVTAKGVPTVARLLLGGAALASGVFMFGTLQAELNVDLSSVGSIATFVEQQTEAATRGVDDTLANASFPAKLFSLLYRPLFFDAGGLFGLVASVQNALMIVFTVFLARNIKLWAELFMGSLAIRFATIQTVALFFMLAFMYYNVGLGLRQREMATPALLIIVCTVWLVARLRRRAALSRPIPVGNAVPAV